MSTIKAIKKWLKLESWGPRLQPRKKKPENESDFLRRILRMAATRASMASWGQPFEAIVSWMLLERDDKASKYPPKQD